MSGTQRTRDRLGPAARGHAPRPRGTGTAQQVLRRRRADDALARSYEALRREVLAGVRGRLARRGMVMPDADLDAFYNQAWQGLYDELVAGREVRNPSGFLVVVCVRRAVDELRRLRPNRRADDADAAALGRDEDHAARMDDRARLRQFVEGMRERLSARECQAAALCYLHDFSRAEAATLLGVEPKRMEKIMDGVSKKVGAFVQAIEAGRWCEERGSLMRAYAFGVLGDEGPRRRLAGDHLAGCPSCRAYVRGLRGLAAALPPVALPLGDPRGAEAAGALEQVRAWLEAARAPVLRFAEETSGGAAAAAGAGGGAAAAAAGGAAGGGMAAKVTAAVLTVAIAGGGSAVVARDATRPSRAERQAAASAPAPAAPVRAIATAPAAPAPPPSSGAATARRTVVRRAPAGVRTVRRRSPATAPAAEFVPIPPAPVHEPARARSADRTPASARPAGTVAGPTPAARTPSPPPAGASEFAFEPG